VRTLHGEPYPDVTAGAYAGARTVDAQRFLADADFVITELPAKLVDRPGRLAWQVVTVLAWRMGPAGPRLLTQLGIDPYTAWRVNRTAIVAQLAERGHPDLARCCAAFYLAGWQGYRSGFADGDAAADAVRAAARLFREGRELLRRAATDRP